MFSFDLNRRQALLSALGAGALLGLSGCGFKLKQPPKFQFKKLLLVGNTTLFNHVRRYLKETKADIIIVSSLLEADVVLEVKSEREKEVIVGQTLAGQIREKQLQLKVVYRLWAVGQDPSETENVLEQYRESSYSETEALAKGDEENLLYDDMRRSIARQLVWRMSAVKPRVVATP